MSTRVDNVTPPTERYRIVTFRRAAGRRPTAWAPPPPPLSRAPWPPTPRFALESTALCHTFESKPRSSAGWWAAMRTRPGRRAGIARSCDRHDSTDSDFSLVIRGFRPEAANRLRRSHVHGPCSRTWELNDPRTSRQKTAESQGFRPEPENVSVHERATPTTQAATGGATTLRDAPVGTERSRHERVAAAETTSGAGRHCTVEA